MKETENLFSYGTLKYKKVQLATFGRELTGQEDHLPGYYLESIEIRDPDVIAKSGENIHSMVRFSGNPKDRVSGTMFKVSLEELDRADQYEVADYKRILVRLLSGSSAWVYVSVKDC